VGEGNVPANVAEDVTRKVLKGRVKCRKAGYRQLAPYTPAMPTPRPKMPPPIPLVKVVLYIDTMSMFHSNWEKHDCSEAGATCNVLPLLLERGVSLGVILWGRGD
jgi:hypothetical protein